MLISIPIPFEKIKNKTKQTIDVQV